MKNFSFINFLPPWVETNIRPAFYDKESGSVLQQTARMYAKVNQLVRHFNCLAKETKETVDEYIAKFIELKDFVDTYFENLDVQEEINNKLDEMVEDGALQEIIASYLNANALWGFDSVSSMASSPNLIDGSFAETTGYYSANDGGGAIYKIRAKTESDVPDNGKIIELSDNNLIAELVVDENCNVKQFGAKGDDTTDDSLAFQTMLSDIGHIKVPEGTFKIASTITLHSNEYIYGVEKNKSVIHYSGTSNCITNEDISTSRNISIHDLTLMGTSKVGRGIYLVRTTKSSDTYHRIYNTVIQDFEYGLYLERHLNELQISDVVSKYNDYGIFFTGVNDFYCERVVSCVNSKDGIRIYNSTEGRFSDIKAWYNGSSDPTSYYNLFISSGLALVFVNLGLQESYGSNALIGASRCISIKNSYLSLPGIDTSNTYFQLKIEALRNSDIEVMFGDRKVGDEYTNRLLWINGNCYDNQIKLLPESDFPNDNVMTQQSNANRYNVCLTNKIDVISNKVIFNKDINFIKNGNLQNTSATISDFVGNGSDLCSFVNGKLRITPSGSDATVNFKYPELPRTGNYVMYVKFKKVSGSGRVTVDYSGYVDVPADATTTETFYASYMRVKTSVASAINQQLKVGNGLVIDVEEVGLCYGLTTQTDNPLYRKSVVS